MWIQLAGLLLLLVLGIGLAAAPRVFAIPFLVALVGLGVWSMTQRCPRCGHPLFKGGGRGVASVWLPAPPRACRQCGLSFVVEEYLMGEELIQVPTGDGEYRLKFIELHDADLEEMSRDAAGGLIFEFSHLVVYLAATEGGEEVWSFRGRLSVDAVGEPRLSEPLAEDDYVMDAVLRADGRDVAETALVGGHRLDRLRLSFFSGASLEVDCTAARLELIGEGKYMQDWPFESPADSESV